MVQSLDLQRIIEISSIRSLDSESMERLEKHRLSLQKWERSIEKQIAYKVVSNRLLDKTCGI